MTNTIDNLLTPLEVSQRLNVSRSQAYSLIKRGELASIRIGTSIRVMPKQLAAFIEQREATPENESVEGDTDAPEQSPTEPAASPRPRTRRTKAPATTE